jgi:multiple sugar transport system permease protein
MSLPKRRATARKTRLTIAYHASGVVLATLFIAPIAWAVLASFRPASQSGQPPLPPWPTTGLSFDNYAALEAFGSGILHYTSNSLLVSVGTVLLTVTISLLAGYGFSRFRFPFKEALFVLIMTTIMIPFQSILTPLFVMLSRIGLQNSHLGLMLVYTTLQLPFSVFMMRIAFDAVPRDIEEAARIDGRSTATILLRVMLPLVLPGIITVAIFAFLNSWNEFLAALVLLTGDDSYTLPVMMTAVRSGRMGSVDWGALQAGVTLMMLPCLIIFLLLQRFYIRGLTSGSVK